MNDRQDILKEIKQSVISIDENAEVILFGSRARGDHHDESDWDVLVLIDKEQSDREYKRKIRDALLSLEIKHGMVIGTLIRNKIFWNNMSVTSFYKEVQKDGMLL